MDENLFAIANNFYHPTRGNRPAFAIYSNVTETGNTGDRLTARIKDLSFGSVFKTPGAMNPKTGNIIAVWTWEIDHKTFKEWYIETKIKKFKRQMGK